MIARWNHIAVAVLLTLVVTHSMAQPFLQRKAVESLKKIFGDSIVVSHMTLYFSPDEQKQILERAKTRWPADSISMYICASGTSTLSFGFVDDVKGKTQLITYLVALTPKGDVADVDVLAYREAYGGEITYETFRKQFRGKTVNDGLTPGREIKNISGATISVRAITYGVRRILATFDIIHSRLK